jgi:transposase
MNQIQATAMNEGMRRKKTLWSRTGRKQLESLTLAPWATRRRQDLLELVDRLDSTVGALTAAIEQEARQRPEVLRLMTHPGVGPITALAFVLIIGSPDRFACGKQIGSYLGLIPCEDSSADRQRLGHVTKQGSALLRFLLVEAAQAAISLGPRLAPSLRASRHALRPPHRQSGDGPQTGCQPLLDVEEGL